MYIQPELLYFAMNESSFMGLRFDNIEGCTYPPKIINPTEYFSQL